jgi:hypothetical protein
VKRQHTAGDSFCKITIGCQGNGRGSPRDGDVAATGCQRNDILTGQLGSGMLKDDDCRIERKRAAEADAEPAGGVQLSNWLIVGGTW